MSEMTIREAKLFVLENGGLQLGESLGDALSRLEGDELERQHARENWHSSPRQGPGCHDCSCHIAPPCSQCVECEVCNPQEESEPVPSPKEETNG